MKTLLSLVAHQFFQAVKQAFPTIADVTADVAPSTRPEFGHYQCNVAMKLAAAVGKPPRAIAEQIVQAVERSVDGHCLIEHLEIAGPGFINIRLEPTFLAHWISRIAADERLGIEKVAQPQRIIVEFSSPNVAKEMHVGHLRSTIIGDCLARLFEFLGHDVIRLNHLGDWGTAFGMLIEYIKEVAPHALEAGSTATLADLMAWYRASKEQFDHDPAFKKRAQLAVVALQGGEDEAALRAWQVVCAISERAYREIYDILDIRITDRGESFYNSMLPSVVTDFERAGLTTISEGATCVFLEGFETKDKTPLPVIIQKSDGGYNYSTTDLAAIKHRVQVERADRIIYVVDAGQSLHFAMIFKAAEAVGYLDRSRTRVEHVGFGLVLGSDGKKFRTRSGDTERLIDLLDAAVEQARIVLVERNPSMSDAEQCALAQVIGIGAIKYADLSCMRLADYVFSYERMLRFEGNTVVFLLYTYVRAQSIRRRVGKASTVTTPNLRHPSEIALAFVLAQFSEILAQLTEDLMPHRLAEYLYHIAEKFNAFFRDCRVEGVPEQDDRLVLIAAFVRTMQQGLSLLGVSTVERM